MAAPFVPSSKEELEAALCGGLLVEGHYLDLKRQLGRGKEANRDLAKDLAAFSIDGGVLYVGVREGAPGQAPALHAVELGGLKERVDQVARSTPRPPIAVRTLEIPSEVDGSGFLLVVIPPSPEAPHMVDGSYWGRSDTTNYTLADDEVVRLHERRAASADAAEALVRAEMARDPAAAEGMSVEAHLFLVAQPVVADPELLLRAVPKRNMRNWVGEAIVRGAPGKQWGDGGYSPNIGGMASQLSPRAHGYAAHTYHVGVGRVVLHDDGPRANEEGDLLDIELREDGGVRLFCGRATRERDGSRLFIMPLVVGMTRSVIEAARAVSSVSSYLGSWDLARHRAFQPARRGRPYVSLQLERAGMALLRHVSRHHAGHLGGTRLLAGRRAGPIDRTSGAGPEGLTRCWGSSDAHEPRPSEPARQPADCSGQTAP